MRGLVFLSLLIILAFISLTFSAAVQSIESEPHENIESIEATPEENLLNVDADNRDIDDSPRLARQFYGGGGYYGRPYGGYGGGFYGRPYSGYYGRPYARYGGYGPHIGFGVYPSFGFYG